jgi:4-amino-4-deoxy-L-arabinose transferase-like glycosyltransferase
VSTARRASGAPDVNPWFERPIDAGTRVYAERQRAGHNGKVDVAEAEAALSVRADATVREFAESQQAGLEAVIGLAQAARAPAARLAPEITLPAGFIDRPRPGGRPAWAAARPPAATGAEERQGRGTGRNSQRFANVPRLSLMVILAVQAALSVRLVWSNTAFMDEALYLWAGHLEIAHWVNGTRMPTSIPAFSTYFSGAPVIYPPLGAIADAYGGLAGARLLSLGFMLGATSLLYATTSRLFGRTAAVAAAAVFALLGSTQFLSAVATYDAMALFLLALSSWLVIRAHGAMSEPLLVIAGLVLALADATKYATALWDPVVIALAALTVGRGGWLRAGFRSARLAVYVAIPLAVALFRFGGAPYLRGVMFTTLARQAGGATTSPVVALEDSFAWLWLVLALALVAVGVSFTDRLRTRLLCIALAVATLPALLHPGQIHTLVSLQSHVAFGAWFGAIAGGYVLAQAAELCRAKGWRVIAAAAAAIVFGGIVQTNALFTAGWPNMSEAMVEIGKFFPAGRCPCLMTADTVVEYYLYNKIPTDEYGAFSGPWNPPQSQTITGAGGYAQAIRTHYFSIAEIDPAENPALYRVLAQALAATPGYRLVKVIPIPHWGRKVIEIWRYEPQLDEDSSHASHG